MNNKALRRILILTANPKNTDQLRLTEEVRNIEAGLKQAKKREQFEIISKWAVRPEDLYRALLDYEPQIVHFSGHGAGNQGLVLEDDSGKLQLVSTESLARLFKLFKNKIECVFLNACYSEMQAEAIYQHINCVVGMNQAIGDRAAIKFAVGFYDALGAGRSFEDAYEIGCTAIDLEGIPESSTPVLKVRPKVEIPPPRDFNKDAIIPKWHPRIRSIIDSIMATARTPLGWFWLLWVVATVIGGFIGTYASVKGQEVEAQIVGRVIGGAVIGLAQWLALRTQVFKSIWWIPITTTGWVVGWAIGGGFVWRAVAIATENIKYSFLFKDYLGKILLNCAVGIAVIEIATGLAQWLLLRSQFSESKWWILATVVSAAVSIPVIGFAGWTLAWVVGWLVFGMITGVSLVWLLQHSQKRA
jgi:hypothetical protein